MKRIAVLLLLFSSIGFAKDKTNLEWKTGVLLDQSSERRCRTYGSVQNGNGSVGTACAVITTFEVDGGEMIYTVQRDMRLRWDKELDVTVNAPIKYAIDGRKFYLQDEEGKAHEVSLVRKRLKGPPSPKDDH